MTKTKNSVEKSLEFAKNVSHALETELRYSQQLDHLISKMYTFVDVVDEEMKKKPTIDPSFSVDHTIILHFDSVHGKSEEDTRAEKRKMFKRKPKFYQKISFEDMCSIVVSGEWILTKQGIYGKGRDRRGEEVTGAIHSPLFHRPLNKND